MGRRVLCLHHSFTATDLHASGNPSREIPLFNPCGVHLQCTDDFPCPLCMQPDALGLCGLLWIGERFYKTTYDFDREAAALGVSRRITAIPRGFQVGKTWILFAHPKALPCPFRCE